MIPSSPPSRSGHALRGILYLIVVLGLAAGVGLMLDGRSGDGLLPDLPGLGSGGPRRGYGDTVIRYADRDYDGAAWVERREAAALRAMMTGKRKRIGTLKFITGLDRDNMWIVDGIGNLFRLRDGHWSYLAPLSQRMRVAAARILADGGIALGGLPARKQPGFAIWRESGKQTFQTGRMGILRSGHIFTLADDYLQFFTVAGAQNSGTNAFQYVGGQFRKLRPDKDRAWFVHSEGNVPIRDMSLPFIRHTATFQSPSRVWGFWQWRNRAAVLRFENGTWFLVHRLTQGAGALRSVWFGEDDAGLFMIAAGPGGLVVSWAAGGAEVDQSVTITPQFTTSTDLIAVWGTDRNNYFVMDSSGTLWQRRDNTWRTLVRGLHDRDVIFTDAWVAPDGSVHAITRNSVYVLD